MAIIRKGTFTCQFVNSGTEKQFPSLEEARRAAEAYCGNTSAVRPFPKEPTYMYGPGDGTTSVIVREDIEFADYEGGSLPQ